MAGGRGAVADAGACACCGGAVAGVCVCGRRCTPKVLGQRAGPSEPLGALRGGLCCCVLLCGVLMYW